MPQTVRRERIVEVVWLSVADDLVSIDCGAHLDVYQAPEGFPGTPEAVLGVRARFVCGLVKYRFKRPTLCRSQIGEQLSFDRNISYSGVRFWPLYSSGAAFYSLGYANDFAAEVDILPLKRNHLAWAAARCIEGT